MVSVLTSSWYREAHSRWMPSSNTSDLPQTFVSLPGQFLGSPSEGYTIVSVTSGDSNNIDQLVLSEEIFDADGLLQERSGECDLKKPFVKIVQP